MLSLIVDGKDPKHVAQTLRNMSKVKGPHLQYGSVFIVGGIKLHEEQAEKGKSTARTDTTIDRLRRDLLTPMGLKDMQPRSALSMAERLGGLRYSPTWVVRYRGLDYVYEGFDDPSTLFDEQGRFKRAD